ncbi:MAG: hypothetical protein ABR605_11290, partial [Desulfurivibrionaceae bacterium]
MKLGRAPTTLMIFKAASSLYGSLLTPHSSSFLYFVQIEIAIGIEIVLAVEVSFLFDPDFDFDFDLDCPASSLTPHSSLLTPHAPYL